MNIVRHVEELIEENYREHFRSTMQKFGIHRIKDLGSPMHKKRFFKHLKTTWAAKKAGL